MLPAPINVDRGLAHPRDLASISQSDRRKGLPRLVIKPETPQYQQRNPSGPAPLPQHNLNEPVTGASSGGMSSEATRPVFIPEHKYKEANRMAANEHKQKLDQTSRTTPVNNTSVLRNRSTKIQESKLEEVTAQQGNNASPVFPTPESPS